jgi:dynactin-5
MEQEKVTYVKKDFLETHTGNKVNRKATVRGTQNIHLNGKCIISTGVMIRGELAPVKIGKNTIIRENVILRPSYKRAKGHLKYVTMNIGDHVYIGENSIICATKIGNCVYIGKNCIISHRCTLRDYSRVEDNTVLVPDTEVPSFTSYAGHPGTYQADLPDSSIFIQTEFTQTYYNKFVAGS